MIWSSAPSTGEAEKYNASIGLNVIRKIYVETFALALLLTKNVRQAHDTRSDHL